MGETLTRPSPASGAVATSQFLAGTGNVLISYEDEAIDARQAGNSIEYIVPQQTVLIQNPADTERVLHESAGDKYTYRDLDRFTDLIPKGKIARPGAGSLITQ